MSVTLFLGLDILQTWLNFFKFSSFFRKSLAHKYFHLRLSKKPQNVENCKYYDYNFILQKNLY
jgi:hypothetical protein